MNDNIVQKGIIGLIAVAIIIAIGWVVMTPPGGDTGDREVNISLVEEDLTLGDDDAPVTIVKYSDLQCPACAAYDGLLSQLLGEYDDSEVQYVYRHFPLRGSFAYSDIAGQALESGARLGEFEEMKTELFLNQAEWSQLSSVDEVRTAFIGYAESLGLDAEEFESLLDSDDVKSKVERDYQSGIAIGVSSTPTFIVNSRRITNPNSIEEFRAIIDADLGRDGDQELTEEEEEIEAEEE